MITKYIFTVFLVLYGVAIDTRAAEHEGVDDLPPSPTSNLSPGELEKIKNITEAIFKEKCDKNGDANAFSELQKVVARFPTCLKPFEDAAILQVRVAMTTGTVIEAFKKDCDKSSELRNCIADLFGALKPCYRLEQQGQVAAVQSLAEAYVDHACFEGGRRLTSFIVEAGPWCFDNYRRTVESCVDNVLGFEYHGSRFNHYTMLDKILESSFGESQCRKLSELRSCYETLKQCRQVTIWPMVEEAFDVIRDSTPCKDIAVPSTPSKI